MTVKPIKASSWCVIPSKLGILVALYYNNDSESDQSFEEIILPKKKVKQNYSSDRHLLAHRDGNRLAISIHGGIVRCCRCYKQQHLIPYVWSVNIRFDLPVTDGCVTQETTVTILHYFHN